MHPDRIDEIALLDQEIRQLQDQCKAAEAAHKTDKVVRLQAEISRRMAQRDALQGRTE
jgi:hypothetical protein